MARTTPELVAGIIEVDDTISIDPFIAVANSLTTEMCGNAGYDSDRMTQIETWLAAHFYEVRDKRLSSEKGGSVSENKYGITTQLYLDNSQYGQMAMFLDTAGGLASWNENLKMGEAGVSKRKAGITWLGMDYTGHSYENPYRTRGLSPTPVPTTNPSPQEEVEMSVPQQDLALYRGDTYENRFIWRDKYGLPVDLTNYTAKMQIRETPTSQDVLSEIDDQDGITLGGADGTVDIELDPARTLLNGVSAAVYDVEMTAPDGKVTTIVWGNVVIQEHITKTTQP